jgi:ribulose bisphosphate carboxylase small subunit
MSGYIIKVVYKKKKPKRTINWNRWSIILVASWGPLSVEINRCFTTVSKKIKRDDRFQNCFNQTTYIFFIAYI